MNETVLRSLRLGVASLLGSALVAHFLTGITNEAVTVTHFLSLFSVLAGIAATVLLTWMAVRPSVLESPGFNAIRGAITVYLAVAGLVWASLVVPSYPESLAQETWIDISLHVIGPIALLADWLVNPPATPVSTRAFASWLVFPAVYLGYTLVRGSIVDWYPYPFLDPSRQDGYGVVAEGTAAIFGAILVFAGACYWWANRTLGRPA